MVHTITGGFAMRVFAAGGVSGNLKPLWHMVAQGMNFREAHENFLGRNQRTEMDSDESG